MHARTRARTWAPGHVKISVSVFRRSGPEASRRSLPSFNQSNERAQFWISRIDSFVLSSLAFHGG